MTPLSPACPRALIAMLAAAFSVATASAQEPGARAGALLTSPEVAADRQATFRLRAPDAKSVTVSGDFGRDAEMRKGDGA